MNRTKGGGNLFNSYSLSFFNSSYSKTFPNVSCFSCKLSTRTKVIGMKVEDHSFKNYVSFFISYSITIVVNLFQQSIFIFHITTFITIFQTLLLFGTRIFKPVSFYGKSKFWQWIIKYSSVTCSFNLHYASTSHSLPILRYCGDIAVVLRYYCGDDTV